MRTKLLLLLCLALAPVAQAESDFHTYTSVEQLIESGRVETLTVVTGNLQFTLRPPRGWSRHADEAGRKIIFTGKSGRSAITMQFTADSPGKLPAEDVLRAKALQAHPGSGIMAGGVCSTSSQPGVCFDLVRIPAPNMVQKMYHAFVPQPNGQVEFVLTAPDDEFGRGRIVITDMLRTFRVAPLKPKQP